MAKLNKTARAMWNNPSEYRGAAPRKVGHNRHMMLSAQGSYMCELHNTIVCVYDPRQGSVKLETGGYLTATTIAAINDYLDLFGLTCRASRAKGEFTVWTSNNKTFRADEHGTIRFNKADLAHTEHDKSHWAEEV